jgi:MoxR-like ATPase
VPQTAFDLIGQDPACGALKDLVMIMETVQEIHVSDVLIQHCVELVRRTRQSPLVELGGSPRAGLALVQATRARALIHGRDYVVPEDILALAEDVLLHRMRLRYEAVAEGYRGEQVLDQIITELG